MVSDNDGNGWRADPMYTISEAAHLARVAPITVRRWLHGYAPDARYPEWRSPPVFGPKHTDISVVSFLQLIEIVVAAGFRQVSHLKLDVIRDAHSNLRLETGIEYPFAHEELESLGHHVVRIIRSKGQALAEAMDVPTPKAGLSRARVAQLSLPGLIEERTYQMIEERLSEMEFELQFAARWFPAGKDVPVVVDPLYSSGLPTIPGRGVTVASIYRRWKVTPKDNIAFIADDLQLDPEVVERVLKYADKIAA